MIEMQMLIKMQVTFMLKNHKTQVHGNALFMQIKETRKYIHSDANIILPKSINYSSLSKIPFLAEIT